MKNVRGQSHSERVNGDDVLRYAQTIARDRFQGVDREEAISAAVLAFYETPEPPEGSERPLAYRRRAMRLAVDRLYRPQEIPSEHIDWAEAAPLVTIPEPPVDLTGYLDVLTDHQRQVVVLYFGLEDEPEHTQQEIADRLGDDPRNLPKCLSRALARMNRLGR